jgi:hypothetical protein
MLSPRLMAGPVESATESMALCRALERAGLEQTARRLAQLALQPNALQVKPLTRVRHCERSLRCWLRGESGAHIEDAIAQLIIGALTLKLSPGESVEASRHV